MLTNYHTHTTRCGHAEGTEEEYILTALRCGFKVLGFSDHTPWAYATPGFVSRIRMLPFQLDDYVLTLRRLRENYADKLHIRIGLEAEYFPAYLGWLRGRDGAAGHRISHPRLPLRHHRRAGRQGQPLRRQHLHRPRQAVCRAGGGSAGNGTLPVSGPPRPLFEPGDGLRRRRRESLPGHLCRSGAAGHPPRVQHGRTDPAGPSRRLSGLHPGRVLAHRGGVPRQGHRGLRRPRPLGAGRRPLHRGKESLPAQLGHPGAGHPAGAGTSGHCADGLHLLY